MLCVACASLAHSLGAPAPCVGDNGHTITTSQDTDKKLHRERRKHELTSALIAAQTYVIVHENVCKLSSVDPGADAEHVRALVAQARAHRRCGPRGQSVSAPTSEALAMRSARRN